MSFAVVLLAALIHASLQLDLGGLLLLYHSSLKKHIKKTTRTLVSNFILGVSLMTLLGLLASAFIILTVFGGELGLIEISLVIGVLFSLALIVWFAYYRTGRSTELWLPRSVTRFVNSRAEKTSSRIEAFSLGMLTCLAEFPFSIILVFIAADSFLKFSPEFQFIAILLYLFVSVSPLLFCRFFIRKGSTIAEIQRWRVKNKNFLRIFSGVLFAVLAVFLTAFKIVGNLS